MFWFDRTDSRAVFVDKRMERHTLPDSSSKGGSRELVIDPDCVADFTNLPFSDSTFALVVFDPPHFERNGETGWVGRKYGTLRGDWQTMLRGGFAECFRVLRPEGVLIFKWCDEDIPLSRILALTPERPLFGHRSGKRQKTHWVAFMKPNAKVNSTICEPERIAPMSECHTCGYRWPTGQHGGHDCATQLRHRLDSAEETIGMLRQALHRIAMNISGDLPATVIAGDTLDGREPGS